MKRLAITVGIILLSCGLLLPGKVLAETFDDIAIVTVEAEAVQRGKDAALEVTVMALQDISHVVVTINPASLPEEFTFRQPTVELRDIPAMTWERETILIGTSRETPEEDYRLQYDVEIASQGIQYTSHGFTSVTVKRFVFNSPCFIATACYGSPLAEEIDVLREYRDVVLMESSFGRSFVDVYYVASPPVASLVERNETLRSVVKNGFVDPAVRIVLFTRPVWCR